METSQIAKIVNIFEESSISVMDLEIGEMKIRLEKNSAPAAAVPAQAGMDTAVMPSVAASTEEKSNTEPVRSPLVGIFYASSKPGAPSYVNVGDVVHAGDVLCIVEAMKTMNELKSDKDGIIKKILVKDGDLVEYDQPIFEMEPLA
jgi:acetyl-CoA carboxylase biotin carboxyl carrier protein